MIIKSAHINGFGIFTNQSINGFDYGINVVYGPNEFGKSTMLDFMRRILFGFPRASKSVNQYKPLDGGQYGGVLECLLKSGEEFQVSRLGGNGKGDLKFTASGEVFSGSDSLRKFTGSITENVFNNVYAFGLDELQIIESLEDEEISNFIYGAGLGLGKVSPVTISREIADWQLSLYKRRGKKQPLLLQHKKMIELRKEIKQYQNEISQYDRLVQQKETYGSESEKLNLRIEHIESEKQKLEELNKMFPVFQEMNNKQNEIDSLPESPKISDKQLKDCEEISSNISLLKLSCEENSDEIKKHKFRKDQISVNHSLLDHKPAIESLKGHLKSYRDSVNDINPVGDKKNEISESIESEINRLGGKWSRVAVSNYSLSIIEEDKIKEYKKRLQEAEYYLRRAKDLEFESKAKSDTQQERLPSLNRYVLYAISSLSLAGVIAGFVLNNYMVSGFAAGVFLLSLPIIIKDSFGKSDSEDTSSIDDKAAAGDPDSNEWETVLSEWNKYIESIGLNRGLTPEAALEYFAAIKSIKNNIKQEAEFIERIEKMNDVISSVENKLSAVLEASHSADGNTDAATAIQIISKELNDNENSLQEQKGVIEQIEQLNVKAESLNKKIIQQENNLSELLNSFGAESINHLKKYHEITVTRNDLYADIRTCEQKIQLTSGIGENYDSFINDLSQMSPSDTTAHIEKLKNKISELNSKKTEIDRKFGELRGDIKKLNTREDILVAQHNLEMVVQKMKNSAREWTAATIAKVVFDKVLQSAEKNRQPDVIKSASSNFAKFTNGRYCNVYKPNDNEALHVEEDASHNIKSVDKLSRGTREQLYLAMRLGLIEEYEKLSEPMPVIFDDIFANFDDDRVELAARAVKEFSDKRQVIIFTCRRQTRDLFLSLGSRQIKFA